MIWYIVTGHYSKSVIFVGDHGSFCPRHSIFSEPFAKIYTRKIVPLRSLAKHAFKWQKMSKFALIFENLSQIAKVYTVWWGDLGQNGATWDTISYGLLSVQSHPHCPNSPHHGTRKISEWAHSQKIILTKVNFSPWRSPKFIPTRLIVPAKVFYHKSTR